MNVGFIGLGHIGAPMALNVVQAGHRTTVHDIRPEAATDLLEAGAIWAETPADAARGNEVVLGSLPGPSEVEAVVAGDQGVLEGADEGLVYIDLATNSPAVARRLPFTYSRRSRNEGTFIECLLPAAPPPCAS